MSINKSDKFCGLRWGYIDENDKYIILCQSNFSQEYDVLKEPNRKLFREIYSETVNDKNRDKCRFEKCVYYINILDDNSSERIELWENITNEEFLEYIKEVKDIEYINGFECIYVNDNYEIQQVFNYMFDKEYDVENRRVLRNMYYDHVNDSNRDKCRYYKSVKYINITKSHSDIPYWKSISHEAFLDYIL